MVTLMRPPSLRGGDPESKREEIRRYFHNTYNAFESLYDLLGKDEVFYHRPEPLRHPHIFYFGHTAVFYVNKLILAKLIDRHIDPELESIFAVGVDEMSWDDLDETRYRWPEVERTRRYRDTVRHLVDRLISELPLELPITWDSPWWVLLMGIEHERIHIETSSVLIRQTPLGMLRPSDAWPRCRESGHAPRNELLPVPGGEVSLGKRPNEDYYGWDNEYGHRSVRVPDFMASRHLVSNGEFLPFVEAGGYTEPRWWSEEGWAWRSYKKAEHPTFWRREDGQWLYRSLTEELPLPEDWPVDVNLHEAEAFCRWLSEKSGRRVQLPTEEEWYRLCDYAKVPDLPEWEEKAPANIHLEHWASACGVSRFPHEEFYDLIGNVWQWTRTPIYPFQGFRIHPVYDDFSTPTFDGRHFLIKGGSFISAGDEALCRARYAFRPHFFQHAGFRYVQSDYEGERREAFYERDEQLNQYCEFGWGREYFGVPNYPERCARIALEMMKGKAKGRALDLGCAVGRSTLELAREFEEVTGIDFSARFIAKAQELCDRGVIRYTLPTEGELVEYREVRLPEDLEAAARKVSFWQGDACNLKPVHTGYDLVTAFNLIDRLYDPEKFLREISERVLPGGLLVLSSPYTWLEEHAPKEKWLGGYRRDGEPVRTLEGLREILSPRFRLIHREDLPFVIRETERKHQHTVAELSVWEKLPE
jgi:5-histidylcysteine sulfoxide synthase/putative 4-mercaptohistidine N1-methyltranferase